jgi:hypothetical protein
MSEVAQGEIAGSETPAPTPSEPSVPSTGGQAAAPDTAEQVAETDEQKNAREVAEQRERSERRARGVQRRLDELTREKYDAAARADRLEGLLTHALTGRAGQPQLPAAPEEPKRETYANYDDWVGALAEHRAERKAEAIVTRILGQTNAQYERVQQQRQVDELRANFAERQQKFAAATPDYFDVVQTDDVRVPDESAAFLHTMEDAPEVIYHMAKHPEFAKRLWSQPPVRQAMLLGALSAQLKAAPQVSKAPPPGKPTGATASASNEPPQDMEGYLKWREKNRSKRG